jgi:predicted nucleic acid-binding protein
LSIYADTSFVVSLYIPDNHSLEAQRQVLSQPVFFLTPLHRAEWAHAVEQHVFRRVMPRTEADRLNQKFEEHRLSGMWSEVGLPERAFEVCVELARRHGARMGSRTLDSLHVACALELKAERFWTFDERQRKLAAAEGLKTM